VILLSHPFCTGNRRYILNSASVCHSRLGLDRCRAVCSGVDHSSFYKAHLEAVFSSVCTTARGDIAANFFNKKFGRRERTSSLRSILDPFLKGSIGVLSKQATGPQKYKPEWRRPFREQGGVSVSHVVFPYFTPLADRPTRSTHAYRTGIVSV
jgi:hypothetical protein